MVKSHIWKDGTHFADQDLSDGVSGNGSPVDSDGTKITDSDTFGSGSGDDSRAFTNVITSGATINSNTADPSTETFQQTVEATSGPYDGGYLWSNPENWNTDSVPMTGDAVSVPIGPDYDSYDDIASLDLASLTLTNQSIVGVVGSELTVTTVAGSSESQLTANAHLAGAPVTVTVGTITASDAYFGAYGAGARFVDESTMDTGNFYYASDGGFFELSAAAPVNTSFFEYNGVGTLALNDPGTTNAFALEDLGAGDVLELPGTSVSNVSFGTNSLTVTTNDGSYDFTNVTYNGTVNSYVASRDPTTALVAITFGGPDTFANSVAATGGALSGGYLWSNTRKLEHGQRAGDWRRRQRPYWP